MQRVPPGCARRSVLRHRDGQTRELIDWIAEEVPVNFIFNGLAFSTMLATPVQLEDFALGFALGEGIITHRGELTIDAITTHLQGIDIHARIPEARHQACLARTRTLPGRSGCGLCGLQDADALLADVQPVAQTQAVHVPALQRALRAMPSLQPLNALTGAVHAAAFVDADGRIVLLREDVGRHNALDKMVGAMHDAGIDPVNGFALISSRASVEMTIKAARAGIGLLAAVSAPTALAVSLAHRCNITLVGFVRDDGHAVYSHPQRLIEDIA